tara:strand:+ start:1488 stop:2141 length:654 start_codon:yes stop_codon:yes gene_type:complete
LAQKREIPYIWVTWLTKLLVGENSCEWAGWFRSNHLNSSFDKIPTSFDAAEWQINHTTLLNAAREDLEDKGWTVFTEHQNTFKLRGSSAILGGKPDLIAVSDNKGIILDVKTGQPSPSHHIQVLLYMYAVPKALRQYLGVAFEGRVVYPNHLDYVPSNGVDSNFVNNFSQLIKRLASSQPARRVPSNLECSFCNITNIDCPDRIESEEERLQDTEDF